MRDRWPVIDGFLRRRSRPRGNFARWLRFNLVGGTGIALQLGLLSLLKSVAGLNYLTATALAVEATVVHNFLWHERYTWADRVQPSWSKSLRRLARFNLTNGAVSTCRQCGFDENRRDVIRACALPGRERHRDRLVLAAGAPQWQAGHTCLTHDGNRAAPPPQDRNHVKGSGPECRLPPRTLGHRRTCRIDLDHHERRAA